MDKIYWCAEILRGPGEFLWLHWFVGRQMRVECKMTTRCVVAVVLWISKETRCIFALQCWQPAGVVIRRSVCWLLYLKTVSCIRRDTFRTDWRRLWDHAVKMWAGQIGPKSRSIGHKTPRWIGGDTCRISHGPLCAVYTGVHDWGEYVVLFVTIVVVCARCPVLVCRSRGYSSRCPRSEWSEATWRCSTTRSGRACGTW